MENIFFERTKELKQELKNLQEKLNVILRLQGKRLEIEGEPFNEYNALRVLEAYQFGFSIKKALTLLEDNMVFRIIPIKQHTRRKNMHEIKARIIGKEGKTKRAIENISSCELLIKDDNHVGIIANAKSIDEATTAIANIVKGSKQSNVYSYLEKMNAIHKTQSTDLGLKIKEKN